MKLLYKSKKRGITRYPPHLRESQLSRHMMEKQGYDGETYNNTKSFEHLTL
jgi:hypothetical protein